jgi:hypothetical protein
MKKLSKNALVGNVRAMFMLAFFTILWASCIAWGFGWNPLTIACIAIFFIYAVWLCVEASKLNRSVRALPDSPLTEHDKHIIKRFRLDFAIEIILIGVSCNILATNIVGNANYIVPVMAVIVGAHFISLGNIFKMRIHIILGIIMIAVAVATIIFIVCGKWINQSIGVCALAAAICVAVMDAYLLHFIKSQIRIN